METLILLVFLGVITFVAAIFDFEALKICKLSTADIVMEVELPIVIVLCYIFLGETLTYIQMIIIQVEK
jgi:uncharacterized membrane protein